MPRPSTVRKPSAAQQTVIKAREVCADPAKKEAWSSSWNRVVDRLDTIFKTKKDLRSFEARHSLEAAREVFLRMAVEGAPLALCENAAVEKGTPT
jgi:hypothetical protein